MLPCPLFHDSFAHLMVAESESGCEQERKQTEVGQREIKSRWNKYTIAMTAL
jgi:hypothetical protein